MFNREAVRATAVPLVSFVALLCKYLPGQTRPKPAKPGQTRSKTGFAPTADRVWAGFAHMACRRFQRWF
jgi:hypothetical protein